MFRKVISFISIVSILTFPLISINSNECASAITKRPFEIISMRSKYEKHFNNGDGTQTAFIDTSPIHYNNENGEWIEIDNTLTKNDDGSYSNVKNSMNVTLASAANIDRINEIDDQHLVSLDYMGYNISWDIVNPYVDDVAEISACRANSYCPIEISENIPQRCIEVDGDYLEKNIEKNISSKNSSVWYKSIFDGCDLNIEVKPASIKENIVLNNREAANNKITYYIETNGLIAELCDDNSIKFTNQENNIIFFIPAPFMFESEFNNVKSYDIDILLEKHKNGYLMSYIPNKEWILSEKRNFPVIIDPDVYVYDNIYTYTLSEKNPTTPITEETLKIGGDGRVDDRYRALISVPFSSIFSSDQISVVDAKLYMHFNSYSDPNAKRGLRSSALLSQYMPWWLGVSNENLSQLNRFEFPGLGYNEIDVTVLASAWCNYIRSNSKVGVYPYGVVIDSYYNYCCIYEADSSSGTNPPYYIITYKLNTNYTLTYSPDKYNDCIDIYNFSKRMNCYAYALQMYHQTYSQSFTEHKLMPGEIGMSLNPSFNTSTQLHNYYNSITNDDDFMNFTEQQMMLDSTKMGTNLQRITLSNEQQFVLPTGYNENTQRIIAMCIGKRKSGTYHDYHFYLRHGNGTCNTHGGNCSTWSHKPGSGLVTNYIDDIIICDRNIAELSKQLEVRADPYSPITSYNSPVRFYTIQQDTNVYNSWYEYNNTSDTVSYEN